MPRLAKSVAFVVIAAAWAVVAATTHAFSTGAEVVTAFALAVYVVAFGLNLGPATSSLRAPAEDRLAHDAAASWALVVWAGLAAAVVAFEIFNFVELPRYAHPTLSSFLAYVAARSWSRGIAFFAWLALGRRLVVP